MEVWPSSKPNKDKITPRAVRKHSGCAEMAGRDGPSRPPGQLSLLNFLLGVKRATPDVDWAVMEAQVEARRQARRQAR
jgi:hypothetical protein